MPRGLSAAGRVVAATYAAAATLLWACVATFAVIDTDPKMLSPATAALIFAATGAALVWQRRDNRLGPVLALGSLEIFVLVLGSAYARHGLVLDPGSLPGAHFAAWAADVMAIPTVATFAAVVPMLFPSGRLLSAGWRWPLRSAYLFIGLATVGNAFYPQSLESVRGLSNPYAVPALRNVLGAAIAASMPFGAVALVGAIASLVLRWRRAAGDERQQLKWVGIGLLALPGPVLLHDVAPVAAGIGIQVALVLLAVTMLVAVLRFRLYDLEGVLRGALAYTLVSAAVAGLYLATVGLVEAMVGGRGGTPVRVLAAVVAAAAFRPLHDVLRRAVDAVFVGARNRPYDALAELARRLEDTVDPATTLSAVVESVAHALLLPWVAIELGEGTTASVAAEFGIRSGDPTVFPMSYQGERIGRMLVCARTGTDSLNAADRRLLTDLARQAGVAAHAMRVTADLLRSRAELVSTREEERRRLRRDLHDGLGPALAGISLTMRAAARRITEDPVGARAAIVEIAIQVETAIADIRALVYGLRPPALDEFGLVRALELHAVRVEVDPAAPQIVVESPPDGLGSLPAAVEVAAYRIACEAMTNVSRHAAARLCQVRMSMDGALALEVTDDGRGIPAGCAAGVGVMAMRERAAELGGTLVLESSPSGGTRVRARLPIAQTS